jgi:hypothetical protein
MREEIPMLQRELGLDVRDLPHAFVDDGVCEDCEVCGREEVHPLHDANETAVERAAAHQLVTEKGT